MKKFIFLFMIGLFSFTAQANIETDQQVEPAVEQKDVVIIQDADSISFEQLVNQIIQNLTGDSGTTIQLPGAFDPTSTSSVMEWWQWLLAFLLPIVGFITYKFFPAISDVDLYLRPASIVVVAVTMVIILKGDGFSLMSMSQYIIAFVIQAVSYKGFWKGLGLRSARLETVRD